MVVFCRDAGQLTMPDDWQLTPLAVISEVKVVVVSSWRLFVATVICDGATCGAAEMAHPGARVDVKIAVDPVMTGPNVCIGIPSIGTLTPTDAPAIAPNAKLYSCSTFSLQLLSSGVYVMFVMNSAT